ncbi:M20/M25/M40 family metallo-hydrolase [Jiangella alkaliphila]|uniref:Glutamate carboxypeptidase n=1 Tax=Jiangella alkaliphila TaxID=419479 RepID=A0A1H2J3E2_9ACTN|nr:M20/M25/M40 family metallo-hydrolase [Jiangella alkaliphila]SDU50954.1 glutamate carboxypeptidase [Jiangella alkaliphila]
MNGTAPDLDAMLARLESYVRHETPTGDAARLDALGEVLLARHRELGGTARRVPSPTGDHLVMEHPGRGAKAGAAPVLFLGHHDTVWPAGQLAGPMPWRVEDGVAHGPGAYDMKSGLVVMETALELARAAHEAGGAGHPPVRVVVVADEEVGSPTAGALVCDAARDAVAALGFESPHPDGSLKAGRRGSTRLRLGVEGVEAHAALDPDAGTSAVDELVDQLILVRSIVRHAPGDVLCNVGTVAGGGRTNVVPAAAHADLGLRFADAESERVVLDGLTSLRAIRAGATVTAEVMSRRPTWAPGDTTAGLLGTVRRAAASIGQRIDGAPAAGGADTNTTGSLGVATLDGFGPLGAGAHAVHEQVVVASLAERARLVAALLPLL